MSKEQPQQAILIHYGEVGLKGNNQSQFRKRLGGNIRRKLASLGLDWSVREPRGSLAVLVPPGAEECVPDVIQGLKEVFGIAWFATAWRVPHPRFTRENQEAHFAELEQKIIQTAAERFAPGKSFAVRVRRADKSFAGRSTDLELRLGDAIITHTPWKKVNLRQPDETFQAEIRQGSSYVFCGRFRGPGGLPVGTAGRVLVLLSGGFDSPLAGYLMAKRGCNVDFLHFSHEPLTAGQAREQKIWRTVAHLNRYTQGSRLFAAPYTLFDLALMRERTEDDLMLFRRFMARTAEQLAVRLGAKAIVTGDNLAQVASQTLSNLAANAVTTLPLLRPLLTYDKEEIMALAERVGTHALAVEPYKDCCALISRHPKTKSHPGKLARLEERLFPDYAQLVEQTLSGAVCLEPPESKPGDVVSNGREPGELTPSAG